MKLAIIWSRFGPYHVARLSGAARAGHAEGVAVHGIEIASVDDTHDWEVIEYSDGFARDLLFPGQRYDTLSRRAIAAAVRNALDAIRPSAVAINGWSAPEAVAAVEWCRANLSVRSILMSESKYDDRSRFWWKEEVKRRRVRRCAAAIVGGEPHRDYLHRLGMPLERIFLGYDVVDNDYFARTTALVRAEAPEWRRRLGLPERYFLACSRFVPRKNIDGLLRAYSQYVKMTADDPWSLVILGNGPEEPGLKALARKLSLKSVHWPGFVQYDRLPHYYALAAAFIHPAKFEPWGLVVNEAAATGLPLLISSSVGAHSTLLREGLNGFLFDASNVGGMAQAMERLAGLPPPRLMELGAASATKALCLTPATFGDALLAAIRTARDDEA